MAKKLLKSQLNGALNNFVITVRGSFVAWLVFPCKNLWVGFFILMWLGGIWTTLHDTHSRVHLPTSVFSSQLWSLSPKIAKCFLNDFITVSVMRAIKNEMHSVLSLPSWAQSERSLNPWECGVQVPTRKQQILLESDVLTYLMASGESLLFGYCFLHDWKSVMEQTWERPPLCGLPTQTMAWVTVDGSGLNGLKCCFGGFRGKVGFAASLGCGVQAWGRAKWERLKSELDSYMWCAVGMWLIWSAFCCLFCFSSSILCVSAYYVGAGASIV